MGRSAATGEEFSFEAFEGELCETLAGAGDLVRGTVPEDLEERVEFGEEVG